MPDDSLPFPHSLSPDDVPPDRPRPPAPSTVRSSGGEEHLLLAPGSRPLPEYELVHVLGRGGFGEVWRAKGPGGFDVALKFVRLAEPTGERERAALELMKGIRHAHLLPMFGAWERDGLLIIAMEVADGTLYDRCKQAGGSIPQTELLGYMREAAEGLDFLNTLRDPSGLGTAIGIQHKDVKPQNLMLVGGTLKVADFSLARLLERSQSGMSGGLSPAYAAPEFFNNQVTRWSDQYSLAVTYCALRGQMPFEGAPAQVMVGHLQGKPNLKKLSPAEQVVLGRALAKEPSARWPSCREFVTALEAAVSGVSPPRTRVAWPWIAACAVMAVVAVGAVLLNRGPPEPRTGSEVVVRPATTGPKSTEVVPPRTEPVESRAQKIQRVEDLLSRRHFREALAEVGPLLEKEHASVRLLLCRGQARLGLGLLEDARADFARAVALAPEEATPLARSLAAALVCRAEADVATGEPGQAITDCDEAIRLDPADASAYYWRGIAHFQTGADAKAIADCETAIRRDPRYGAAHGILARVYLRQDNLEEALSHYNKALKLDLQDVAALRRQLDEAYRNRGQRHERQGEHDKAIADCTQAILLNPGDVSAFKTRAQARYAKKDYAPALSDYREVIRLRREDVDAHIGSGNICLEAKRYPEAIEHYSSAIQLGPDSAELRRKRAECFLLQRNYAGAVDDYDKVLQEEPRNAEAWRNRGRAHEALGEYARAMEDCSKAIELDGRDPQAWAVRARARNRLQKWAEAIDDFTQALELTPGDAERAELYAGRSSSHLGLQAFDKALGDSTEALRLDPNNPTAKANRALALSKKEELDREERRRADEIARRERERKEEEARRADEQRRADELARREREQKEEEERRARQAEVEETPKTITDTIGMEFVLIPKGSFEMGSPADEEGRKNDETQHTVVISKPLYMGKYPVTMEQFRAFVNDTGYETEAEKDTDGAVGYTGKAPKYFDLGQNFSWRNTGFVQGDTHPVVNVTWKDAQEFCKWRSRKEGKIYRLPTEAEWEYSCRAGSTTRFYNGDAVEDLKDVANLADATFQKKCPGFDFFRWNDGHAFTAAVDAAGFSANRFKLYGMHGNVRQWCADRYDAGYYQRSPENDPPGPAIGKERVLRGSSWNTGKAELCRCASRDKYEPDERFPDIGFRVVRVISSRAP